METVAHPPKDIPEQQDIRLLVEWTSDSARRREAGLGSVLLHAAAVVLLMLLPKEALMPPPRREVTRVTPLVAPPVEITQNVPNKAKLSKEINADAMTPRPRIQIPPSPPSTTRPAAPRPSLNVPPAPAPKAAPQEIAEPPRIETAEKQPPAAIQPQLPAPAPPPPQEKPRIAFENVESAPVSGKPSGRIPAPGSSVEEAMRGVARSGGAGGIVVGDAGEGVGGIGEALNMPPSPGRQASALELLSDPMGVDFRPYLIKILASVRRNWWAVMPESAKLGRRGRTTIQFSIDRVGRVPKLVIVTGSGTDALDRAAVAGISASNPFPPLPTEFKGAQVRLQFTFTYNMPAR